LSTLVTACLDEWLPTTEPGLQADSIYYGKVLPSSLTYTQGQTSLGLRCGQAIPGLLWLRKSAGQAIPGLVGFDEFQVMVIDEMFRKA
jgi:hypothetical protein